MCRTGEEMGKRWHLRQNMVQPIAQLFQPIAQLLSKTWQQKWDMVQFIAHCTTNTHKMTIRKSTEKSTRYLKHGSQAKKYICTFLIKMWSKISQAFHIERSIWYLKKVGFNFNLRVVVQPAWYLLRVHFSCRHLHILSFTIFWHDMKYVKTA